MPNRKYQAGEAYRYGFNGKENDNETGTQDYGMRIYNASIGKFLSVDPLEREYLMLTPYQFASNRPIEGVDLDGLEFSKTGYFKSSDLISRLVDLKNHPEKINQGGTGTCMIAAVTYLWIKNDWNSFVGTTMSLYHTGKAKINDYEIESQPIAQKLNPNTSGSSQERYQSFNGEQAVDWMVMNSIQNTQNGPHFGLSSEEGGNNFSDLKEFMTDLLNLKNVTQKYYETSDYKPVASILVDMQNRFKNGMQEIISINPNALNPGAFVNAVGPGGHAVVYAGNFTTRMNKGRLEYSFDVISWGKKVTLPYMSETDFQNYFKGSSYGKPEEKK